MKDRNLSILGGFFVVVGLLLLLTTMGLLNFSFELFWPTGIIFLGLFFHYLFFSGGRQSPGVLVPGGILLTIGLLFFINVLVGWHLMSFLWPVFILSPAVGLFELYVFGSRSKGLLIPIVILSGLGGIFLFFNLIGRSRGLFIPALLIILGLVLIINNTARQRFR